MSASTASRDAATTGDVWRGTKVGKYEVLTQLSAGGMAELFLAYTQGLGGFRKFVVIKRILPDAKENDQFVRMFLDEARITAAFNHPNIAQVYDLGDDEEGLYLAMEFIAGQNLNQVTNGCARQKAVMPLGLSASVVHDCAQALHYAHTFKDPSGKDYPVIHRDVAQKNIMVTYDGQVKLLDFGIAKARGTLGRTFAGSVKGTAGYMSPEQVRGDALDGRSDVFSLGVVLFEMITGQRLFAGNNEVEEMRLILTAPIPRPSEVLPIIPDELSDVCMRALARDKADRFGSARDFSRALQTSCSHLLFDQEQRATFMRELFEEKIRATQLLLESAGGEMDRPKMLNHAVRAMKDDAGLTFPVQKVAQKAPRAALEGARRKKAQKAAQRDTERQLEEVSAKASAMAESAPPPAEGKGLLLPVVILAALGVMGFGVYQTIFGHEEPPPTVQPYASDVKLPEFGKDPQKGPQALPVPGADAPPDPKVPGQDPNRPSPDPGAPGDDPTRVVKKGPAKPQGQFTLFTIPPGATVLKGRTELGKTPLVNYSLPAGNHLLTVVGPDGKKRKLSVPVEVGKKQVFKFNLDELPED